MIVLSELRFARRHLMGGVKKARWRIFLPGAGSVRSHMGCPCHGALELSGSS